jgi:hypothetical protein
LFSADLLHRMLAYPVVERISAMGALQHPFFSMQL